MTRPRNAPTAIANLSPEEELRIRVAKMPPQYSRLLAVDAEIVAEGRHLPGLMVQAALRAESHGLHEQAVGKIRMAQTYRQDRGPLPASSVAGGLPV